MRPGVQEPLPACTCDTVPPLPAGTSGGPFFLCSAALNRKVWRSARTLIRQVYCSVLMARLRKPRFGTDVRLVEARLLIRRKTSGASPSVMRVGRGGLALDAGPANLRAVESRARVEDRACSKVAKPTSSRLIYCPARGACRRPSTTPSILDRCRRP